jgi:periplasmic protein TonB
MVETFPTYPIPRGRANERLKGAFSSWYWGSLAVAALIHFAVFAFWPTMSIAALDRPPPPIELVNPVTEHRIPPPPDEIARPAFPVPSETVVDIDRTIPPIDLGRSTPETPRPSTPSAAAGNEPRWTPTTALPRLPDAQRAALQRHLERHYPTALRQAGVTARVLLWVHVDVGGRVTETRVVESSGYEAFDALAREAMAAVRFVPAKNRDETVPVWIQLPVQFLTR